MGSPPDFAFLSFYCSLTDRHSIYCFSETKSSGYSYFNIDSVDTNLDQGILELNMSLPSLRILGDYYLDGTVYAGDPVFGFGTFTVQLHVVSCRGFADFISDEQGKFEHLFCLR